MITGSEHEEMLKDFISFEYNAEKDRDQAIDEMDVRSRQNRELGFRVRSMENTIKRVYGDIRDTYSRAINKRRKLLSDAREEANRELRKLSILMNPTMLEPHEMANVWIYNSDWLEVYMCTQTNNKPVNGVDLIAVRRAVYDIPRMELNETYYHRDIMFEKSFKTDDDAWRYYERNRNKIFDRYVKSFVGDEESMVIEGDPREMFNDMFDFRMIYQRNSYNVRGVDGRWAEHRFRAFMYDASGNRSIEVKEVDAKMMKVEVGGFGYCATPETTYECIIRYVGDCTIEVEAPDGVSRNDKTCFQEIEEAINEGPLSQICVDPSNNIFVVDVGK
ncbi:MAG: hypothetical protein ACXQTO_01195 [Candidatus Syntropharchaeales archaeon]